MKVGLIYPGISWSGFGVFGKKDCFECNFINHGVASIASYLTKFGHKIEYFDLRMFRNWHDFRNIIKKSNCQVFGISATTVDFGYSIKIAKIVKKLHPKIKVVIGGVHATVRPAEAMRIKEFDYVVTGEGEIAMKEIVDSIATKKPIRKKLVKGVPVTLEEIPHIDRDLFYHRVGEMINPFVSVLEEPSATIMSSRGCPYNCAFCQPAERSIFGGKVRLRKMEDVVDEIKEIHQKYGLKSFMIHDDLFIISKDRIMEFVNLYKRTGIKAKFICQARADLIIRFKKEIKELKKVGLVGLMIGFESGSQKILDYLNKQTTVEQNIESAKICKKLGISIWANYMLGIPSESYWDMIKTLWMIRRINPEYMSPSLFTPYPETKLYDYCQDHGLLMFTKYDQYRRSLGGDKIKGFNYKFIRILIFLFMPFKFKLGIVTFVFRNIFRSEKPKIG